MYSLLGPFVVEGSRDILKLIRDLVILGIVSFCKLAKDELNNTSKILIIRKK